MKHLLLFACFVSTAAAIFATALFQELERFNDLRRAFAKSNAIPNMWRLDLDIDLMKQAEKFDCKQKRGDNYRYFLFQGGKDADNVNQFWIDWLAKTEKINPDLANDQVHSWENKSALVFEYVAPHQTHIGCADVNCVVEFDVPSTYVVYRRVCLFGPSNVLNLTLPLDPKSGKIPGSECGHDGSNFDGLCVRKNWKH